MVTQANLNLNFSLPFAIMAKSPPKKKKPRAETSSSSDEDDGNKNSCPICGHGNYRNPRSIHQHIKRKHPNYAKLSEMKARISEASREPKQKCPHCHCMKSKLSRHMKTCTSRPELGSQDDAPGTSSSSANSQFIQRFRARLNRPGSGFAESTVKNYLNYIRRMIGKSILSCDSTSSSLVRLG